MVPGIEHGPTPDADQCLQGREDVHIQGGDGQALRRTWTRIAPRKLLVGRGQPPIDRDDKRGDEPPRPPLGKRDRSGHQLAAETRGQGEQHPTAVHARTAEYARAGTFISCASRTPSMSSSRRIKPHP